MKLKTSTDFNLFKKICSFYIFIGLIEISRTCYLIFKNETVFHYSVQELILIYLIDWFFAIGYMALAAEITQRRLQMGSSKWSIFLIHLIFALFFSLCTAFIAPLVKSSEYPVTINGILDSFVIGLTTNLLLYFSITLIVYNHINTLKIEREHTSVTKLKDTLFHMEMKVLEAQLEPHFLFNSLNTISGLILQNQIKAQNMLADLSSFLRKALELRNYGLIPIKKEIDILSDYISLLSRRYGDELEVQTEIGEETLDVKIPGMIIQPIIENSIKHGFSYNRNTLRIFLEIYTKDKNLYISVRNNGKKIPNNSIQGIQGLGLSNTYDRLVNYYKDDFTLELQNTNTGVATIVTIRIDNASK